MHLSGWRRWLITAIAFALVAGAIVWLVTRRGAAETLRLPDGREATVVAVTRGTNHLYAEGSPLAHLAVRYLPKAQVYKLGVRFHRFQTTVPSMVVWTEWLTPKGKFAPNYASVRDGRGIESHPQPAHMNLPQPASGSALVCWAFENYPRTEKMIPVRFYEFDLLSRPLLQGSLTVRNPSRITTVVPESPPAPVTARQGALEFTLHSLRMDDIPPHRPLKPYNFVAPPITAIFEVREKGSPSTNWVPNRIEGFGSSSNHFLSPALRASWNEARSSVTFQNVLWPDDPSWRIAVEFNRTGGFDTNDPSTEIWTLHAVPSYSPGNRFTANCNQTVGNVVIKNVEFIRSQKASAALAPFRPDTDIVVNYVTSDPRQRVSLLRVTDEAGNTLRFGNAIDLGGGRWTASLETLLPTATLYLTFVTHRIERVEFNVRPLIAFTNSAASASQMTDPDRVVGNPGEASRP